MSVAADAFFVLIRAAFMQHGARAVMPSSNLQSDDTTGSKSVLGQSSDVTNHKPGLSVGSSISGL